MSSDSSNPPRPPTVNDAKSFRIGKDSAPPEDDTGPETRPPDEDVIAQLASMKPLEYDRVRAEYAERMGCRITTLDAHVKAARHEDGDSADLPFPEVEPWPDPVVPAEVLDEVSATIRRFVVMEPEEADAASLWVAFTWFIDSVAVAPLAIVNAPEMACGKSVLLDIIGRMSARPLPVSNVSTASLFRSVELWSPTLLIDEADTFVRENAELKGLINAGHTRTNAFVLRVEGDNNEPKRFPVWGAKALAGINLQKHLPDATMSRAIVFNLRRKLQHESVERLRHADPGMFEETTSKLARFAMDYTDQVRRARPALPDALNDRDQDNFEPLLAIAECAGPDWVSRATAAALKLSGTNADSTSTGHELLVDIREIFVREQVDKISTADLIYELCVDDERPWDSYNRGREITPRQLANLLSPYGIKSKTVRVDGRTPKGFSAPVFIDAFARYLADPVEIPQPSNDPPDSSDDEDADDSDEY
jgi:putative DNA primase/helicase